MKSGLFVIVLLSSCGGHVDFSVLAFINMTRRLKYCLRMLKWVKTERGPVMGIFRSIQKSRDFQTQKRSELYLLLNSFVILMSIYHCIC